MAPIQSFIKIESNFWKEQVITYKLLHNYKICPRQIISMTNNKFNNVYINLKYKMNRFIDL